MSLANIPRSCNLIIGNCMKLGIAFSTPDSVRTHLANKHWNPRWRKFRALKVRKVELPDYHKDQKPVAEMTDDERRSMFKELGVQPVRPWTDKPFSLNSTAVVFEEYVPPEGDGKLSPLNSAGAAQKYEWLKKKGRSWKDFREIRKFDQDFELYPNFVDNAQDIYIKAHQILASDDRENMLDYVTEKAYPILLFNCARKTIRWNFVKSLEPPRVCHIRTLETFGKYFAQITVRFHTQQTLAIYDRFGRLLYGSEAVGKDVLEYVVFEKHLANPYCNWRMHHKIIPEWVPKPNNASRTYLVENEEAIQDGKNAKVDFVNKLVEIPL